MESWSLWLAPWLIVCRLTAVATTMATMLLWLRWLGRTDGWWMMPAFCGCLLILMVGLGRWSAMLTRLVLHTLLAVRLGVWPLVDDRPYWRRYGATWAVPVFAERPMLLDDGTTVRPAVIRLWRGCVLVVPLACWYRDLLVDELKVVPYARPPEKSRGRLRSIGDGLKLDVRIPGA